MNEVDQLPRAKDDEHYLLGVLSRYPERADNVLPFASELDFPEGSPEQALYREYSRQHANGGIDPKLAASRIQSHRDFEGSSAAGWVLTLAEGVATAEHAASSAARVVEARKKRQRYDELQTLANHSLNGYSSQEIDRQLEAAMDEWRQERSQRAKEKFTFADLRKLHPTLKPVLVDGLIRSGETCNVISYSKVGKSWMVYGLALSIITGQKWLGRFETTKGKVLHVDNELHKCTLAHRIPTVADAMGIPASAYDEDLEVVSLRGNLRSLADLGCDLEALEPGEYKAIILDAKYRFALAGVSENDNAAETALYNELDRIAEQTQAAIVLVHHASKGDQSGKRVTDVGAGAGAQSRAADCHIVLREHEEPGVVVLEAAVRSFAPVEPLALRWDFPLWLPAFDVDPVKLKGRQTRNDERQNDKDREGMDTTLTALVDGPSTARALRTKTGFGEYRQGRLLDLLSSKGEIVFEETKIGGKTHREYRLS